MITFRTYTRSVPDMFSMVIRFCGEAALPIVLNVAAEKYPAI
jgi:hypothetical protein